MHCGVAGLDRLGGEHHRLEPGAADLVDGERGHHRRGTPAWIIAWRAGAWPLPPCTTWPMITSSTAAGSTLARPTAFADDHGAELRRGERGQPAEIPADGRAHGGENDGCCAIGSRDTTPVRWNRLMPEDNDRSAGRRETVAPGDRSMARGPGCAPRSVTRARNAPPASPPASSPPRAPGAPGCRSRPRAGPPPPCRAPSPPPPRGSGS